MSARDRILARLSAHQPRRPPPLPDLDGHDAPGARAASMAARLARFRAHIEAAHAEVHVTDDPGSLILWPSAAEPRTLSLVPPLHLVLLAADSIHPTLYEALRAQRWTDGLPTNALLISGPSKTADIQQTLAYGAHGPQELIVLVSLTAGDSP